MTEDNFETFIILSGSAINAEVVNERIRAHNKHDINGGSMERKGWYISNWLSVVMEEVGEVARATCEYDLNNTTEDEYKDNLREELIQVMAMCQAWVNAIDKDTR